MIIFRIEEILSAINRDLVEGVKEYSAYALAEDSGVSLSSVYKWKKGTPVERIDASVIERLLEAVNKRRHPRTPEFNLNDLLEIVSEAELAGRRRPRKKRNGRGS
jgi:hypothetical protein